MSLARWLIFEMGFRPDRAWETASALHILEDPRGLVDLYQLEIRGVTKRAA